MRRLLTLAFAVVLLAGCTDRGEDVATQDVGTGQPEPSESIAIPIAYKGRTGGEYCITTSLGGQCVPQSDGEHNGDELPKVAAKPLSLTGHVEWNAHSENAREFTIALIVDDKVPSSDFQLRGPSPLAFDWNLTAFHDNATYELRILALYGTKIDTVEIGGEESQEFEVNATLLVRPIIAAR